MHAGCVSKVKLACSYTLLENFGAGRANSGHHRYVFEVMASFSNARQMRDEKSMPASNSQ
jgi:hypothetical protein